MPDLIESPDIKQLGAEALRDLLNNLTQAKGFVLDQAPEFCRQLIMWEIASGVVAVIAMLAAWIVFIIAMTVLWRGKDTEGPLICVGGVGGFAVLFLTICGLVEGSEAFKAYIAPKVFLVEELTRMLR